MTIREALNQRIPRIRQPQWANPECYLRLPLFDVGFGPWAELYDERSQRDVLEIRPGSQRICVIMPDVAEQGGYETYTGKPSEYEQDKENYSKSYKES